VRRCPGQLGDPRGEDKVRGSCAGVAPDRVLAPRLPLAWLRWLVYEPPCPLQPGLPWPGQGGGGPGGASALTVATAETAKSAANSTLRNRFFIIAPHLAHIGSLGPT
jgi:hypothetical protein